ncbi:kinase-like domain-containing protein [Radiomyces spectabilis]|uniref:kinase-like domain-containing protein n=1 Tax=Radiomyces spectabilis TaxID=64574 RepID=UPI00221E66D3|nr:kinase-like domain-containing protein [Radiomyces spectabilis]KAI8388452.1 kinase-like domain-containing protein [Radiomyces spectabilis]
MELDKTPLTFDSFPTRSSISLTTRPPNSYANEIIDQSQSHDSEKVIEVSPNERYIRLNTLLGKGAYKVVYKAIDRDEGYEVAWNTMQAMNANDGKDLEHEIEILKSVRHPNIIAFHDAWYGENEFVFITELMTSGTLREYIRKLSPLPNFKIVKRWSRQILKGLAYLHGHSPPIIHRDIKCDNIFINGAHGEVKIGDMGTAEMKLGKKYTLIGTPEFMAPEMYEEQGYNEKVDIYAFGMCLLEMATGEYPYGECKNAAQIYKKVSAGIKPASLQKITNEEVLGVINNCLGPEDQRMSAQDILEHSFLAVEPDVVLLTTDPNHVHLTLQVVFKGMDKLSVKFDFNVETDTAEEVVREMIEEQVLPERYQHHITKEINRILRDLDKLSESEHAEEVRRSVWRRENDVQSELAKTQKELERATERVAQIEARCEGYEGLARQAEARYLEAMRSLREADQLMKMNDIQSNISPPLAELERLRLADSPSAPHEHDVFTPVATDTVTDIKDVNADACANLSHDALVSRILEGPLYFFFFVPDQMMGQWANIIHFLCFV